MRISREEMTKAVAEGLISPEQAQKLIQFWQKEQQDVPSFRLAHVLYYLGGLLAIAAITLFVTQAWEKMVGLPLFIIAIFLFLAGLWLTRFFLDRHLAIPAGIMATFSLIVVPLAVYNLQMWMGYSPGVNYIYSDYHNYVNWFWVPMELATLAVGAMMLYYYQFPFLLFPIAVTLWYMSMDLFPLLYPYDYSWTERAIFSMYFGLIVTLFAVYMDISNTDSRKDYAFWLYIFGVITFWCGLSSQDSSSEMSKFIYCLINLTMIFISVFLNRRIFAIFGAIGILLYLGHLAYRVFPGSLSFPIALVLLGLLIIFAAAKWSCLEDKLNGYIEPYMPEVLIKRRHL